MFSSLPRQQISIILKVRNLNISSVIWYTELVLIFGNLVNPYRGYTINYFFNDNILFKTFVKDTVT